MTKKLKPCPFCGGDVEIKILKTSQSQMAYAACAVCSCKKSRLENPYYDGDIEQDMIKSWNKRVGGNDGSEEPAGIR